MSVQATTWVWDYSQAEGNARLVLLAIADAANKEGCNSCQSLPTIAEMCRLGRATVARHIKTLEELGELEKEDHKGAYGTSIYRVVMKRPNPSQNEQSQNETPSQYEHQPVSFDPSSSLTVETQPQLNPNIPKGIYPSSGAQKAHTTKQARSLPEGWMPDPNVVQQMQDELRRMGKQIDFEFEHRKFTDHFNSVGGAKGRKKDWNATWRNWMRTARVERGQQESAWVRREKQFNQEREMYRQMDQQGSYFGAPAITEGKGLELE